MSQPYTDEPIQFEERDQPTAAADPSGAGARGVRAAVIDAIAETEGVDALELEFSLQSTIDVDVLDGLATQSNTDWRLEFAAADHEVAIEGDGTVTVDDERFPNAFDR